MIIRYALLLTVAGLAFGTQAQTALTASEYAALKSLGQLPVGAIQITQSGTPASEPAAWFAERGGGGACGCWVEPDASYTVAMPENDDLSTDAIALPFTFSLFGASYNTLYINNNGNVSFEAPWWTYTANGFPDSTFKMVAPFWADVDTRDTTFNDSTDYLNGQVLYKITDHALFVNWVQVGYFSVQMDKRNTFQLIITDGTDPVIPNGNNVSFCYGDMHWTTGGASSGVNGFGGISATVGVNNGDGIEFAQVGRFNEDSDLYTGAYVDSSGVDWLDSTHFYLNTAGTGIPPIFGSTFDCDTVIVQMPTGPEVRDDGLYHLYVLPGAQGQQVSCTSISPTLPNFVNINAGPAEQLDLVFPINSDEASIGTHYITFTAFNDAEDQLSSTYVLQVEKLGTTGIVSLSGTDDALTLSPNPATDVTMVSWPASAQVRTLELVSADGRVVLIHRPNNPTRSVALDLKTVPPGTYLVRATAEDRVITSRLVRVAN